MGRLIDADALVAKFENIERTPSMGLRGIGLEPLMAIKDIKTLVQSRPTIEAIPVEWLEKRRENLILEAIIHSTVYGDNSVELCHAVNVVLDMWQKEQEAQNG